MLAKVSSHKYFGFFLGLVAGLSWGTTSVGARYLAHSRGVTPALSVFWRFTLPIPLLLLVVRLWGRKEPKFDWKDLPKLAGLAALGVFLMGNTAFMAVRYTTNVNVTIIVTASAVLIALVAYLRGAPVTRRQWAGVAAGLAGVILIGFAKSPGEPDLPFWKHGFGILLATGASLSWALYTVFGGGMVAKYGGLRTTVWAIMIGALMQLPLALGADVVGASGAFTLSEWAVLSYLALVPTALGFTVWFIALRYIDSTTLGMTQYVGPALSAFLGWLLLGEDILPQHYVGAALIFVGLHFAQKTAMPAPAPLKIEEQNRP